LHLCYLPPILVAMKKRRKYVLFLVTRTLAFGVMGPLNQMLAGHAIATQKNPAL
jgi:hypothetical protein